MIPLPKEAAIWRHASRLKLPRARAAAASTALKPSSTDETTLHMMRSAGLARGMRVIEAGCDGGAQPAMAGELVGAGGCVIAVVASSFEAVRRAVLRDLDAPVDALIGRGLLQNTADAAEALRELVRHVHNLPLRFEPVRRGAVA